MKKKKQEPTIQARRRLFFVRPICFVLVILVLITFVKYSIDLYNLNNERRQKEEEYVDLQEKSEYLRDEVDKLQDPEELAKYAREKFLYSKDGEVIIKIEKDETETVPDDNKEKEENMAILFLCSAGVIIIFIYIIIRSILNRKKDN